MTTHEYSPTVGSGKPIQSTGKYSYSSEGTNFTDDPVVAESYVDFGRNDPRVTGRSNYIVETKMTPSMMSGPDPDGYFKSKDPVPSSNVTRVWETYLVNGDLMVRQIKP